MENLYFNSLKTETTIDGLRGDALPERIRQLNDGTLPELRVYRTAGGNQEMVLLSAAQHDYLLASAVGSVPDSHWDFQTDDFVLNNLTKVADLLLGRQQGGVLNDKIMEEGTLGDDYLVMLIENTANSGVIQAVLLNPDYYDQLLAAQP